MHAVSRIICTSFFLVFVVGICMGRNSRLTTTIEVSSTKHAQSSSQKKLLNGYCRALGGQTISYHSSHPDAENALLVRARRDMHSISWETDTLPKSFPGKAYRFIWLAGIECKGWGGVSPHEFKLYINDDLWFTFTNRKDQTAGHWTVSGKDGAELTFDSQMVDKYGDLFGYMYMDVPKRNFRSGSPLVIRVEGEKADSPEWFMTFTYHFNFVPKCLPEPVLLRDNGNMTQQLRISLDNLEDGRNATVSVSGRKQLARPLDIGGNIIRIPIPAVGSDTAIDVEFISDKVVIGQSTITVTPPQKRNIYLLPYSHNDIGYTDLQPNVELRHWAHLEEALRLIRETRDYPYESRFKWNMEILWPLESYLRKASSEQKQEVLDAIRSGSIGLNALYVNPLTGLANSVEMAHLLDFAEEFSKQYAIAIPSATVSDIPGFTWGIVTALAENGVKYFSSAPNSGDRIGYVIDQWGDKPFYWSSQSGEEKVLFWVAGSSYSTFHQGTLAGFGPEKIIRLAQRLNDSNHPYDMYFLPYTLGDNGGPDSTLSDFVKAWNEKYITPTLTISTHEQMFLDFEKKYGPALPTYIGDFTPYWEDGALSTAYETALSRHAVDQLIQAEAVWSIRSPEKYPKHLFDKAWRDVCLWDEHTWGADKSVTEPDDSVTIGQWKVKRQFALQADSQSSELLAQALGDLTLKSKKEIALDVYNTSSWKRSDLVILTPDYSDVGDRVQDEKGTALLSQRLSTGELAVMIENIPPFSAERITVTQGHGSAIGSARARDNSIENNLLAVSVDKRTGAIASLIVKSSHAELVDEAAGKGINQYIYVPGKDPDGAQFLSNVRIRVKEDGPLVASLVVEADAPGCGSFVSEIRVIHNLNRVDIINQINKKAIRTKEGVHFAFPFSIPDAVIHYDVASGIVQPERDQLAGSCKNFYSVVSWVDVSNDSSGVTWTTKDAPLIEIGSITAEAPWLKENKSSACFFSYVMNNYWHTNYRADQEGIVEFRYSLFPHKGFNASRAARLGREQRQPLIVSPAGESNLPASSLFEIESSNIVVESVKPVENGQSWLLYLFNPSTEKSVIQIIWQRPKEVSLFLCDRSGKKGTPLNDRFTIPPFGTQYVRVDR